MVVDCGVMFPENDMFGIDLVLPDFDYVVENQDMLRGIVLTHGHMDHVLALSYLLQAMQPTSPVPVYGTALTLGIAERRLKEMNMTHLADMQVIEEEDTVHLGPFRVHPFAVAHSIPDAVGFVINTPIGSVVHTGDYKLDETPAGGHTTNLARLRELTKDGVLAMLGDSTNADKPGRTETEQVVHDTLDKIFAQAKGNRIIIATFSSLLARLQEILYLARDHGRKVALTGRSLRNNFELAEELGYLDVPRGLVVDVHAGVPKDQLVILSTGSQGEPRSALNRMANGSHRQVRVGGGDTIIISGGTIPGNEEDVGRMLNNLFERGANVIYESMAKVHVSGHGSRDELRTMLETVNPRFLVPAHGESRHLYLHAQLAQESGMKRENIFILKNGAQWVTDGQKAWQEESLNVDEVYVDGRLVGEIGEVVMRDRRRLSQDGFIVALIPVDAHRNLAGEPQFVSRGFVYLNEAGDLLDAGRAELKRHFSRGTGNLRGALEDFFYRETHSRPVVLPRFVQV
jgi:ribonuclease J